MHARRPVLLPTAANNVSVLTTITTSVSALLAGTGAAEPTTAARTATATRATAFNATSLAARCAGSKRPAAFNATNRARRAVDSASVLAAVAALAAALSD